jgi:murein L,D-transpeptidase YcbB/YkuD
MSLTRSIIAWPLLLLALIGVSGATYAQSAAAARDDALKSRVTSLPDIGPVTLAGDNLVSRLALRKIYLTTGYHLLWQDETRVSALLDAIRAADDDGLNPEDYHLAALTRLNAAGDRGIAADLLATDACVLLLYHLYFGKVDPLAIEPNWNFRRRRLGEDVALEMVIRTIEDGQIRAATASVRPKHVLYEHGRAALAHYREIERAGGWVTVPAGPKLAPGADDPRVPLLRRRLAVTGEFGGSSNDATVFDADLAEALKTFQRRHLLNADGVVGPATLHELNVPVSVRIDQIRLNLERGRWVLHEIGDEDLVVVDIAGYGVRYLRSAHVMWRARAIIGKPYRQTPIFRADITNVVFNPTWTVPPGILASDVLPQLKRGENVLARKNLRVLDRSGKPVDSAQIDWSKYTARNVPYMFRQEPGDNNALGHVKINSPNPHLVYLHDTPSRSLFDQNDRSFSSGCIRVERPLELAEILLADPAKWNAAAIQAAVKAGTTRSVNLPHKVAVLFVYWTVDADADGHTLFKRDVYQRDAKLLRALDSRFSVGSRPKI